MKEELLLSVLESVFKNGDYIIKRTRGFLVINSEYAFTIQRNTKAKTLRTFDRSGVIAVYQIVNGKEIPFQF